MDAVRLDGVRSAIDSAPALEVPLFARRTRNAIAQEVLAEALAHEDPPPPAHEPPLDELRARLGDALADELAGLYAGGPDWTTRAIDALEPLHALARGRSTEQRV